MDMLLSFIQNNRKLPIMESLPDHLSVLMLTPRFEASRHVIFLVMSPGQPQPILVAKVPRLPQFNDRLAHEAHVLKTINALRPGGFQSIPQVLTYKNYQGYPDLLETALNGTLISPEMVRREPERIIYLIRDWLFEIQSISTRGSNSGWYASLVETPLLVLRKNFPLTARESDLVLLCEKYFMLLKEVSLPYVLEHGDLSHPNLMLIKRNSVGIFDWELATFHGLIASDFFFFLSYVAFSKDRANDTGEYIPVFDKAFFGSDAWTQTYIQEYCNTLKIPSETIPALFLLCWFRYLVKLIRRIHIQTDKPISVEFANLVRQNRYYLMWKNTTEQYDRLHI